MESRNSQRDFWGIADSSVGGQGGVGKEERPRNVAKSLPASLPPRAGLAAQPLSSIPLAPMVPSETSQPKQRVSWHLQVSFCTDWAFC